MPSPSFMAFILEPEIPHVAKAFIDDTAVKGPASRYETSTGEYEMIPENAGIRRFIWEHLCDVHRVLYSSVTLAQLSRAPRSPSRCRRSLSSVTSATTLAVFPRTPRQRKSEIGRHASPRQTSAPMTSYCPTRAPPPTSPCATAALPRPPPHQYCHSRGPCRWRRRRARG